MFQNYDIIVVGAGHAGCEAALVSAKLGSKVLLITMNISTIGQMSCNPAMGGIAKGQIIREIDALGGGSGIIADKTTLQFRMLNKSKGPAMWSPRTQNDRIHFSLEWKYLISKYKIDIWEDNVIKLIIKNDQIIGVYTYNKICIYSKSVIITNGTFLNGLIHIGNNKFNGGRFGEKSSIGITEQLKSLGFKTGRLKTGTSPRVDKRTINYNVLIEQKGDINVSKFSFNKIKSHFKSLSCYIAYTNEKVHKIIKDNIKESFMYDNNLELKGPRYCPSIEDKIIRFSDKKHHQIFIEPDGYNSNEVYINGFSTSLSINTQIKSLQLINGFEKAKIIKPGYAIEYDYFDPTQLYLTMESKKIKNLFMAGQINGTTGYEEAACQGMIAGINAYQKNNDRKEFIIKRSEGYIGVLIDDLVTKGTKEPYRMFTSRAEHRLLLRQDNADIRLSFKGHKLGLISNYRIKKVNSKILGYNYIIKFLKNTKMSIQNINSLISLSNNGKISNNYISLYNILLRPEINIYDIANLNVELKNILSKYDKETIQQSEINIKYGHYLIREQIMIDKINSIENYTINPNFEYQKISSLSSEAKEKLSMIKPKTLGQASRISGISASDISILAIKLRK